MRDPFRPPKSFGSVSIENKVCRYLMARSGRNIGSMLRRAGADPMTKLVFGMLVNYEDFPMVPHVSDEPLDTIGVLFERFDKSRLYKFWLDVSESGDPNREPYVVMEDALLKYVISYRSVQAPERPHLCVGHGVIGPTYVEPLFQWCVAVQWAQSRSDNDQP
jgi:hypothetical protein